ncbi:hypothetical protein LR48_Vigan10g135700 [Vigna angularis]|uniref:Transposase (putative) gypsy type domain-containing protein n=1 Tax=Phaseolus angularis TaxID=3914 RepID=A0A0L9VKA8_PHAAN|nr:hypothetical protein LR48_Vigan10g135700 [Vigna angularis]
MSSRSPLLVLRASGPLYSLLNFLLSPRVGDLRKILRCQSQRPTYRAQPFLTVSRRVAPWVSCGDVDVRPVWRPVPTGTQAPQALVQAPYVASLYASAYDSRKDLEWRVNRTHIVRDVEDSRLIRAGVSLRNERVYYGKRSSPGAFDFFYMYVNVFTQLFVRVPFTKFQMAVLREANVAPAQLHPNSWAAVQAFLAMCLAVGVTPTIPVIFHYTEVRPPPNGGWVSFTSVRERTLFRPFSDSFKNFKHHYFKVIIDAAGRHEFHNGEGNPLFPFYWTREPRKMKAFPVGVLSPADLEAVRTTNALPRRISARHLVECLSLRIVDKRLENVGGSTPEGWASGPDPLSGLAAVHVDPSSEAATASVAPLVRKRKDPAVEGCKDKEGSSSRSASKKARKGKEKEKDKERVPSVPLPGDIFSLAFSMSDRTKFHMSSSQRALIEPLSELELTNAMLEMSTRAASLTMYLKEFADRPGVEDIEQLEADLEKSKKETAKANDRLAVARGDHERLLEECNQLKIKVSRQQSSEVGLLKVNRALTNDLTKANEKIAELEATIVFEREESFNKALRQASLLTGIQESFALGFDIEKDVFNGVLVDLNTVDDEEPGIEGPSGAAGNVEAGKAEAEEEEGDLSVCHPSKPAVVPGGTSRSSTWTLKVQMVVALRKESFVNRPPKLTVVPGGTLHSSTWTFEAQTAVVLRKELSVHRPAKLTVVPWGTLRSSTWTFEARTTVVLRKELSVHRSAKLTMVPWGTLRSLTWTFETRTTVVLRKELSVHRPTKLTVVPWRTLRSSTWTFLLFEI